MADKKVTELTAITSISGDDLLMVVNDPLGTPASRKITVDNVFKSIDAKSTFKANTSFTGTRMTVSANLMLSGTNVLDAINDRMQVANTTALTDALTVSVNDRLQVANASATYISLTTLKDEVAASADFADFQSRIAAL